MPAPSRTRYVLECGHAVVCGCGHPVGAAVWCGTCGGLKAVAEVRQA